MKRFLTRVAACGVLVASGAIQLQSCTVLGFDPFGGVIVVDGDEDDDDLEDFFDDLEDLFD